jgi:hypothetical protein
MRPDLSDFAGVLRRQLNADLCWDLSGFDLCGHRFAEVRRVLPANYYSENTTKQCLMTCLTGYSDPVTHECTANCSKGSYGHNKQCLLQCPGSPTVFADDTTNLCVALCPTGTYGSTTLKKCVAVCPSPHFGYSDATTRSCTNPCPTGFFADNSTRVCVSKCPSVPAMFGYVPTRTCFEVCPFGYADMNNATRLCVAITECSPTLNLFADNSSKSCVSVCPTVPSTFGNPLNRQCMSTCPSANNLYADNLTRRCVNPCPAPTYADPLSQTCVSLCKPTYFGINTTRMCSQNCPGGTFADHLLTDLRGQLFGQPNLLRRPQLKRLRYDLSQPQLRRPDNPKVCLRRERRFELPNRPFLRQFDAAVREEMPDESEHVRRKHHKEVRLNLHSRQFLRGQLHNALRGDLPRHARLLRRRRQQNLR